MAKTLYVPVNNLSSEAKKILVPVGGVSKYAVKGYCSVNGLSKLFYSNKKLNLVLFDNNLSPAGVNWNATKKVYNAIPDVGSWTTYMPDDAYQYLNTDTIITLRQSAGINFQLESNSIRTNYSQGACTVVVYIPIDRATKSDYSAISVRYRVKQVNRYNTPYNNLSAHIAGEDNGKIKIQDVFVKQVTQSGIYEGSNRITLNNIDYIGLGYCTLDCLIDYFEVTFNG